MRETVNVTEDYYMVAGVDDKWVPYKEKVGVEHKKTQVCGADIDAQLCLMDEEAKRKEKEERKKKRRKLAEEEVKQ